MSQALTESVTSEVTHQVLVENEIMANSAIYPYLFLPIE